MTYEEIKRAIQTAKKNEKMAKGRSTLSLADLQRLRALRSAERQQNEVGRRDLMLQFGASLKPKQESALDDRSSRYAVDALHKRLAKRERLSRAILNGL